MENQIKIHRENYGVLPERFITKIESDIAYILESKIPELKYVYLFGSCARGDLRSSSDIDLLILTKEKIKDRTIASTIRSELDDPMNGVKTDVVFMNVESIQDNTVFNKIINKEKKLILEVLK